MNKIKGVIGEIDRWYGIHLTESQMKKHLKNCPHVVMGEDGHVDHIIPISWFVGNNITDPAIINALSNLRPLWAKENLLKGAKLDYREDISCENK